MTTLDLVLRNANILIGDASGQRARSIGIRNGLVEAVSMSDDLQAPVLIDVEGKTIVPGFHDAHCHTSWYGLSLGETPLMPPHATCVDDIYRAIEKQVAAVAPGEWIIGAGFHPLRLGGESPKRRELDRIAPDNPVWLIASSGHASVVNSKILSMLDFSHLGDRSPLEVDEFGESTGLLEEDAHACVLEQAKPYTVADLVTGIGRAHAEYVKVGITSVQEAGIGAGLVGHGGAELTAYQEARESGALQVRTTLMPAVQSLHGIEQSPRDQDRFGLDLGIRTGFGDDWLRIGPVKFFTDGSVLAQTADMHEPYGDRAELSQHIDKEFIRRRLIDAHSSGWQLAVHAQGDAAIDFVLDCFEEAQSSHPRTDPRHRIEHCSVATDAALVRMERLGVIPSPQGRFIGIVGDGLLQMLNEEQLANTYRGRTLLDHNLVVAGSSDRPCTEGTPLFGIHNMVNRLTDTGQVMNAHEALTPHEAMRAYAHGSAYATFREETVGTLEPGKLADLVVLSDDPTGVEPSAIRDLEVMGTAIGGQFVFDPSGMFQACSEASLVTS